MNNHDLFSLPWCDQNDNALHQMGPRLKGFAKGKKKNEKKRNTRLGSIAPEKGQEWLVWGLKNSRPVTTRISPSHVVSQWTGEKTHRLRIKGVFKSSGLHPGNDPLQLRGKKVAESSANAC